MKINLGIAEERGGEKEERKGGGYGRDVIINEF